EVGLRVRVLADDDVALLETEHPLRLEAERPRAARDERIPQVLAGRAREVELVPELPDEADAQRERGDAGDVELLRVQVLEGVGRYVVGVVDETPERGSRLRPCEIHRREGSGD